MDVKKYKMNFNTICILRGIPGSGKTTYANHLIDFFGRDKLATGQVMFISRDEIRMKYAKKHKMDYVATFKDFNANRRVRDKFLLEINFCVNDWYFRDMPNRVIIIDSTFSNISDIKTICKMCKFRKIDDPSFRWQRPKVRIFEFNKLINNHRNVPLDKIAQMRLDMKSSADYINSHFKSNEIVKIN